nr:MAG TPA: distal tail protein [Caudoviricetes sp.]
MTENSMTYNGVDLSGLLKVLEVKSNIGNERSIKTEKLSRIGTIATAVEVGAKEIEVKVSLASFDVANIRFVDTTEPADAERGNINELKERIAGIFDATEPKKLTLGKYPNRYFNALVKGDMELEGITDWYDETTIKFYIPDGVAHSTTYKRVVDYEEKQGKMVFAIDNKGTADAYPIITFKANDENGYYGLVSERFAFEAGSIEEADIVPYKHSEILWDYVTGEGIIKGLADGQKNVAILNDNAQNLNGTLALQSAWGRPHLFLANRGSGPLGNHAGSLTWDIPADSVGERGAINEYLWWRQVFWVNPANQYGFIKISFTGENGEFLYGVETIKRGNGLNTEYNFLAANGNGGYRLVKQWTFWPTHNQGENPFTKDTGWCDLIRRNDKVQVHWYGTHPEFTIPEIAGKKSVKVHVAIGAFGDKPIPTHMYLDSIVYRKDFVNGTKDVPNRYAAGSTLVINGENDSLILNNIPDLDQVVDGSLWPVIPPGKSEIEILQSSWAKKKPSVTIEFEERWL